MIKLSKSNVSHLLLLTIAAGVFLSNPLDVNTPTEVSASTLAFEIVPDNFTSITSSTAATSSETLGSINVSDVQIDLGVKNATRTNATGNKPATINLAKDTGVLYNINPLPGTINSLTITTETGQSNTLHVSNSGRLISSTSGDYSIITGRSLGSLTQSSSSQTFTSSSFSALNNENVSYFAFIASGGTTTQMIKITFNMTVSSVVVNNGSTYSFAIDFLAQTANKNGLCTDAGLKWSFASVDPAETSSTATPVTLEGQYAKLTEAQQTAFRTDTTDIQIVTARQRYIYLRTVNSGLTNFASL